jgi:hypothetical protein
MNLLDFYDTEDLFVLEEDGDIDACDAGVMIGFLSA